MNYRKGKPSDVEQLSQLFDEYRVFYKQSSDLQAAKDFITQRIEQSDSVIFVTENLQNELVAFVQLYPIFSSTRMKRLYLLNDLYVNPAFRGLGISKALIDCAKVLAKENHSAGLLLETEKTNTIGNTLYPRAGFVLDEEHNYYSWNI